VDPLKITPNRVPPTVIIEEMLVNGQPHDLSTRSHTTNANVAPIEMMPGRHYVQFRFTGLNFAAPDGVRFRVKLDGVDDDWQSIGNQRFIPYGPLLPGDYKLHVTACNNEGIWNEVGDTLAFVVLPHFWETWWFKIALAAAGLTGLSLIVAQAQRRRYRRKLDLVQRQREMERERTRIAQDLHDELGTSLTQISMLSALAYREQTPSTEARGIIQQVRGRAREMVTALDEIVWAVNPKNDSLIELVNYFGHFADEFFRPTSIRCRLDIPKELPNRPVTAELRHHLFLAFKEAANNAARHSGATEVRVRVETRETSVVISLEDNGCGFEERVTSDQRRGNGLTNMKQRLETVGGHTQIQSIVGQGTLVAFHLPLV
jgi:signal transduction histidine kinase